MAKMIKYKDSFVNTSLFLTMFKRVQRVNKVSDNSSIVTMEDQNRNLIEVKTQHSIEKVIETVDNEDYSGEIAHHLFSYYIGEI